ncbi:N-acetyltransferase GCN5 [Halostagnicola larsenii XH-48]|uniref:N-acetyltransferase GCN5 n=1 Tax=Halostagnicola larsenii XH-48 TaxID=797299 RepID=W0JIT1_9EURY|nr:GNAT family N-acetyltransferase [Halostagnicola larsenii]AHF98640.1 N-acetyltransferase GCN5 [Halostagnicola larsenii XH-48]
MTTGSDADAVEIRRATHDDYEDVAAFTGRIWANRGGDYIPDVYHDWLEDDDETGKKTFLAELEGDVAGIVQGVMLSPEEAWFQGMRVNPAYQRRGVSQRLNEASFEWARRRGATIGRVMVFSWNSPSLGAARKSGFEPITEFRFATPEPDADASGPLSVSSDPADAWRFWHESDARDHLRGLGMALEQSWALRELTREDFSRVADETALFVVEGGESADGFATRDRNGARAIAYRTRTMEPPDDGEETTLAEYGVGAWADVDAARSLFAAIARDAAAIGADETRVLIPETAEYVSDASYAGVGVADEPDFVLGIDLSGA